MPDKVLCFDVDLAGVVLCHPPTYVNKVLLGARDGRLELWNVRSGKRVHAYASIAQYVHSPWAPIALMFLPSRGDALWTVRPSSAMT